MIPELQHPDIGREFMPTRAKLLPTPSELIALLDRRVIGQTAAKRSLAVAAYNHFLACARSDLQGGPVESGPVLLIGPTGCGKSFLLKTLRECMGIPMIYVSCTSLTQNGYKGTNVNEVLERLEAELLEDGQTQPAIVVWDEVDKLRELPQHHPIASRGVQQDLLTYFDGILCGKSGQLDSSRLLNVACGAFVDLAQFRKRRNTPSQIGFLATFEPVGPMESLEELTTQHLVDYGLIPEFVGRFSTVTELDPITPDTLRLILCKADDSAMVQKMRLFELHGISLEFSDNAIDEIVSQALAMRTGARSLKRILERTLEGIVHRLPDMAAQGVATIMIDAETVRGEKAALEKLSPEARHLNNRLYALRKHAGAYSRWKKKPDEEQLIW